MTVRKKVQKRRIPKKRFPRKYKEPAMVTLKSLDHIKPPKFKDHLTLTEVSRLVRRDKSWVKQLETDGRIPQAARVQMGQLSIRLWSPAQVQEIKQIFSEMKVGRPKSA